MLAYAYACPYYDHLNNPNENVRFYLTAALVDHHTYVIDTQVDTWGWVNDLATKNGHKYSIKAPGTSWLGVPFFAAYRAYLNITGEAFQRLNAIRWVRLGASALPTILFLIWFRRRLLKEATDAVLAEILVLAVAVGSLIYPYGILFVSHTHTAIAAFVSFTLLRDLRRQKRIDERSKAFFAGLFAAAIPLFDYQGAVTTIVLGIFALFIFLTSARERRFGYAGAFAIGAILPVLVLMHYHYRCFDNPFTSGHLYAENNTFRARHHEGFFGVTEIHGDAVWKLLVHPYWGIFSTMPILAMSFVGWPTLTRSRTLRADAIVSIVVCFLSYFSVTLLNNWKGGWVVGARFLPIVVPFLAWPALRGLEIVAQKSRTLAIGIALGTAFTGFCACGLPALYYPHIPEDVVLYPLPQLFWPLLVHGFAPHNLGLFVGVPYEFSMWPLFIALGLWLLFPLLFQGVKHRFLALFLGAVVAVVTLLPLTLGGQITKPVEDAQSFVTDWWQPAPPGAPRTLH